MAEKEKTWGELGGNTPMHSKTGANPQKPGKSSQEGNTSLSRDSTPEAGPPGAGFYAEGGKGSSATNKDFAGQHVSGTSGPTKQGGDERFANGGSTAMFGNRGSLPARGGSSAP